MVESQLTAEHRQQLQKVANSIDESLAKINTFFAEESCKELRVKFQEVFRPTKEAILAVLAKADSANVTALYKQINAQGQGAALLHRDIMDASLKLLNDGKDQNEVSTIKHDAQDQLQLISTNAFIALRICNKYLPSLSSGKALT